MTELQRKFMKSIDARKLTDFQKFKKSMDVRGVTHSNPFVVQSHDGLEYLTFQNFKNIVQEENIESEAKRQNVSNFKPQEIPGLVLSLTNSPYWDIQPLNMKKYYDLREKFLKEGKMMIEDFKDEIQKQDFLFQDYVQQLKNFVANETYLKKKAYMETGNNDLLNPNFASALIQRFEAKGFTYFYQPEPPSVKQNIKISLPDYSSDTY